MSIIVFHLADHVDHITPDGTELTKRPYPFAAYADATGQIIEHRDAVRMVGFVGDVAAMRVDRYWEEYVKHDDPSFAVGKYLITEDDSGHWFTQVCAVERVEVRA